MKDIPGFEDRYAVTKDGEIWSYRSKRFIKATEHHSGYYVVTINNNGGLRKQWLLHRLVAMTFIENPQNKPAVNHIDGNKSHNQVSNLEWCSYKENSAHASLNGLNSHGEGVNTSKLTAAQVKEIRMRHKAGNITYEELSDIYGIAANNISGIVKRKTWKHV